VRTGTASKAARSDARRGFMQLGARGRRLMGLPGSKKERKNYVHRKALRYINQAKEDI